MYIMFGVEVGGGLCWGWWLVIIGCICNGEYLWQDNIWSFRIEGWTPISFLLSECFFKA